MIIDDIFVFQMEFKEWDPIPILEMPASTFYTIRRQLMVYYKEQERMMKSSQRSKGTLG